METTYYNCWTYFPSDDDDDFTFLVMVISMMLWQMFIMFLVVNVTIMIGDTVGNMMYNYDLLNILSGYQHCGYTRTQFLCYEKKKKL